MDLLKAIVEQAPAKAIRLMSRQPEICESVVEQLSHRPVPSGKRAERRAVLFVQRQM